MPKIKKGEAVKQVTVKNAEEETSVVLDYDSSGRLLGIAILELPF